MGTKREKERKEKRKKNQENGECDMWHGGKWGKVSPTFDQFGGMKMEKMGKSQKEKGGEKSDIGEKGKWGRKGKGNFLGVPTV